MQYPSLEYPTITSQFMFKCQGKAHASEAVRSAAERARYQGKNYTPHDLSTPPSEIMKIRPCTQPYSELSFT